MKIKNSSPTERRYPRRSTNYVPSSPPHQTNTLDLADMQLDQSKSPLSVCDLVYINYYTRCRRGLSSFNEILLFKFLEHCIAFGNQVEH